MVGTGHAHSLRVWMSWHISQVLDLSHNINIELAPILLKVSVLSLKNQRIIKQVIGVTKETEIKDTKSW